MVVNLPSLARRTSVLDEPNKRTHRPYCHRTDISIYPHLPSELIRRDVRHFP
jgi:hypothetical protein